MMHFPKDKHRFEWNLSCVAFLHPAVVAGRQSDYCTFLPLPVNVFRGDYRCDPDKKANSLVLSECLSVVGQGIDLEVVISVDWGNHIVTFINTLGRKESKIPSGVISVCLLGKFLLSSVSAVMHYFANTFDWNSITAHTVELLSPVCNEADLWVYRNTWFCSTGSDKIKPSYIFLSNQRWWYPHPDLL